MLFGLDGARAIVLWWTLPAYLTLIGGALLISGGVLVWRTRPTWPLGHAVDSLLLASALGLTFARAEHVALNWGYFSTSQSEVFSVATGGLGTHGAVIGAVLGGYMASRLFKRSYKTWLNAAAFALPIVAFSAWWGCAASSCAYGAEVPNLADFPSWLVWESRGDFLTVAPRYAVQVLGMWASAAVLFCTICSAWFGASGVRRAAIALLGVMLTSFALGYLRGDASAVIAGLRAGQWLDLALSVPALLLTVWPRRMGVPAP